ncbi:hypothetical protein TWF696_002032 [Orbilia brochopaga]|uniref:Uncharacterized protein n=1 Tax=Orbilia brochopaga TaxID=3140254 RepID=A0AAV9UB26_9PEZI
MLLSYIVAILPLVLTSLATPIVRDNRRAIRAAHRAALGQGFSRRGVGPDAAEAVFKVAGDILGSRQFQDYKYNMVYPMSAELGFRIEPTYFEGGEDDEYLPGPHLDEIRHYPSFDYAYQIWKCIHDKQHDDPRFCVNEIGCCVGIDRACENLGRGFCNGDNFGCIYNRQTSELKIWDHTHQGVGGWLSGFDPDSNAPNSTPRRTCPA